MTDSTPKPHHKTKRIIQAIDVTELENVLFFLKSSAEIALSISEINPKTTATGASLPAAAVLYHQLAELEIARLELVISRIEKAPVELWGPKSLDQPSS